MMEQHVEQLPQQEPAPPPVRHLDILTAEAPLSQAMRKPNAIRTTKYTYLTWLPVSLIEQFRRIANAYFLFISILMLIGTYATFLFQSPLDPYSTISTLTVILLITSCKEGYEDLQRKRSDKFENNKEVTVVYFEYDCMGNVTVIETVKKSKDLCPGEIVKLHGRMAAPADLLIILTSMHADGNKCYIETANIDGETNLKLREAPSGLTGEVGGAIAIGKPVPDLFQGKIEIEEPNANIHSVVGALKLDAAVNAVPIDMQNVILRSAVFTNTEWAYGVVLYAGQETKIQMNSHLAPSKLSKIEQNLNKAILMIFTAQCTLVTITVASVYMTGNNHESDFPYVFPTDEKNEGSILPLWLELWFVFFLLYNNFIPLSLYVTIEIVNLGQAYLVHTDTQIYHAGLDEPCAVRASNLVQELGMVSNIFSDKTGTLTRNEMKLVKFVLAGTSGKVVEMAKPRQATGHTHTTRGDDAEMDDFRGHRSASNSPRRVESKNDEENDRDSDVVSLSDVESNADIEMTVPKNQSLRRKISLGKTKGDEYRQLNTTELSGDTSKSPCLPSSPTNSANLSGISGPIESVSLKSNSGPIDISGARWKESTAKRPGSTAPVGFPRSPLGREARSSQNFIIPKTDTSEGRSRLESRVSDVSDASGNPLPPPAEETDMFYFLRALMVCHTVVRESNGVYRAESPDELALVEGASESYDCELIERGSRYIKVKIQGHMYRYEILAVNPFNAERKRMSVLLKDTRTQQHFMVCKGADNIMTPLCSTPPEESLATDKALSSLAQQGLRTLVIAQNMLDEDAALDWLLQHRRSSLASVDRESAIAETSGMLEVGMNIIGITAIEDKLQDEVPEVIADLAKAGIIVWMLTGDKLETAVNIGYSCNLLVPGINIVMISGLKNASEFKQALRTAYEDLMKFERDKEAAYAMDKAVSKETALVLEGPSFSYFDPNDEEQCMHLLEIGKRCRSVVACRLTPIQKREIVSLTKNDKTAKPRATTLSIGDGANDVSMILEANVGVGIFGKEGRQAANNADFAVGEFKFLRRLVLVHGRWNYVRQSKVFLYSMHKNMSLICTLFWFSFFAAVSGTSQYQSWIYSGFNFVLGLPIILFGIMDRDLSDTFMLKYPETYGTGRTNVLLRISKISQWILNACAYGVVVDLMMYYVMRPYFENDGLYEFGTFVIVGLQLSLQLKVSFFLNQWSRLNVIGMAISVAMMFLFYILINVAVWEYHFIAFEVYSSPIFWLFGVITVPITVVQIDTIGYYLRLFFCPTNEMLWREVELKKHFEESPLDCRGVKKVNSGSIVHADV